MSDVIVKLTEDQSLYVQQLLSIESDRIIASILMFRMEFGPDAPKNPKFQEAIAPFSVRQKQLSAIEDAFESAATTPAKEPQ